MNIRKLKLALGLSVIVTAQASAVPWCHGGTIVEVANVVWSGSTTIAMASGYTAPPSVVDEDRYQVFHATHDYCQSYAGGGGPIWWNNVPGAGSVNTITYAPYILTNTVNDYDLSMGVSFKCKKCYSIPPLSAVKDFRTVAPLPGTEGKAEYEEYVRDK
ncbi:MAG: hypothetical protein R3E90_15070 [Marinicella sp.]|nr:hypothetical protein [Xanthomonadales bacterium]